jgi:hypothetical protein
MPPKHLHITNKSQFHPSSMAWYEIPNTNAMSIYATLLFGVLTIIFVFRLWLKATCGKFESNVS